MKLSISRNQPAREPHPDGGIEARLQQVRSMYEAAHRTERRIKDIRSEQKNVDEEIRASATFQRHVAETLGRQSERLRAERAELEAFIAEQYKKAAAMLAELGDDAVYLGPVP